MVKDGDVIDMGKYKEKRPDFVWECSCGGQHFWLHKDNSIQCRSCNEYKHTIMWGYREEKP